MHEYSNVHGFLLQACRVPYLPYCPRLFPSWLLKTACSHPNEKLLVGWVHECKSFHKKTINQLTAKLYFRSGLYVKGLHTCEARLESREFWLQRLPRFSPTKPTEDWCRTWAVSHNCCYSYSVSFSPGHLCVYSSFSFSCVFYARWSRHRGRVLFELRLHFPHRSLHRQSKVNNKKSKIQFIYSNRYFPT